MMQLNKANTVNSSVSRKIYLYVHFPLFSFLRKFVGQSMFLIAIQYLNEKILETQFTFFSRRTPNEGVCHLDIKSNQGQNCQEFRYNYLEMSNIVFPGIRLADKIVDLIFSSIFQTLTTCMISQNSIT